MKRSTISNIVLFHDYITKNINHGKKVDLDFTDNAKCFDRNYIFLLLHKLGAAWMKSCKDSFYIILL